MTAPVCPISRSQPVPGMPGTRLPYIPLAVDLPSAIAALHAINLHLMQPTMINNVYPPEPIPRPGTDGPNQDGGGRPKKPRWVEVGRVSDTMRISNIDDDEAWVELDVIKELTFRDEASGNYLYWKLEL